MNNIYKNTYMSGYVSIKEEVLQKLEANMPEIRERFGIETLGIFGSVSRGEDTLESDIDVLYRFEKSRGRMRDIVGLHDYLKELFHRKIDLISIDFISPLIENEVRNDTILCNVMSA